MLDSPWWAQRWPPSPCTDEDASVYLEEYTRTKIGQEELHNLEIKKMLRDCS